MKNLRLTLSLTLVALIVVFSIQNAQELQVNFLFWSITTRRVFILFAILVIGVILGWTLRAFADARAKSRIEEKLQSEK